MDQLPFVPIVSKAGALNFFYPYLKEEFGHDPRIKQGIIISVTTLLADVAQTSTQSTTPNPSSVTLPSISSASDLHELYVQNTGMWRDGEVMKYAGQMTLFLGGFYRPHVLRHFSEELCSIIGKTFFMRAARYGDPRERKGLEKMGYYFSILAEGCWNAHQRMMESRYLLNLPPADPPPLILH